MKSCKGCKHLVAFWCHQNTSYEYVQDPYTEEWGRRPIIGPIMAETNRTKGDCGPERVLFEGNWRWRIKQWLKDVNSSDT